MNTRTRKKGFAAVALLAAALWVGPTTVRAEEPSQAKQAGSDFGIGVATAVSNVGYMPVKVCYAVLGGVTGSLAYLLTGGNREVADGIWVPSLGGDYVLTAEMIQGQEQVRFSGIRKPAGQDAGGQLAAGTASAGSDEDESGAVSEF